MGYFDALASSCFKTAQDGRKLFFPWGVLGRGYAVASEEDYKRLQRQFKVYMAASIAVAIGLGSLQMYVAAFVIAALLIVCYAVWMRYWLRGLQPSNERLSLQESMISQARGHSLVGLWLLAIAALAFVACGILIFVLDPGRWLVALTSIVFFGLAAAKFTRLLVLRRRAAITPPIESVP